MTADRIDAVALRALAVVVEALEGPDQFTDECDFAGIGMGLAERRFYAAANPTTVLALIADWKAAWQAEGERQRERDLALAEVDRLRRDFEALAAQPAVTPNRDDYEEVIWRDHEGTRCHRFVHKDDVAAVLLSASESRGVAQPAVTPPTTCVCPCHSRSGWHERMCRRCACPAPVTPPTDTTEADDLRALVADGIEAFRLTKEYVNIPDENGFVLLPDVAGWSHFDWTERAAAALARNGGKP